MEYFSVSEAAIKAERSKAKDLRKSRWWQNQIAQNAKCYYCQTPLTKTQVTLDHVLPVSQGGKGTKGNCVIACKKCNSLKKSCSPMEWQAYMDNDFSGE